MKLIYEELEIEVELNGILQVEQLQLKQELNHHAFLFLKLLIEQEKTEEIVTNAIIQPVIIREKARDGNKIIFQGNIESFNLKTEHGFSYLCLKIFSFTKEWDRVEKSHSYLNGADTYLAVANKVIEGYDGADIKDEVTKGALIPEMLLQYVETDWAFLRRLASHFHTYIFPDASAGKGRIYFGMPKLEFGTELNNEDYILSKDMTHYTRNLMPKQILPQESSKWNIKSRQYLFLGEQVCFNHVSTVVTKVTAQTEHGEFVYRYELSRSDGIHREIERNKKIYGMSLPATVKELSGNRIRVHFDFDSEYEVTEKTKYFTYAIESSSIYCMPEEESRVHIYFPNHEEQSAIAVHGIGGSSMTKDGFRGKDNVPDNKRFSSIGQGALDMTPEMINFTSDSDSGSGSMLHMGSDGNIILTGNDIHIKTQMGFMAGDGEGGAVKKLLIRGDNQVSLKIGEDGQEQIVLTTEANIIAAFVKESADYHPPAKPCGAVIEAELAESDKENRDMVNMAIKSQEVTRRQESKGKLLKGSNNIVKMVAFTALAVCAGNVYVETLPFAPVLSEKTALAVADIRIVSGKAVEDVKALKDMNKLMCQKEQVDEMMSKVGADVLGGMTEGYLATEKIAPTNVGIIVKTGILKGSFADSLKVNSLNRAH